MIGLCSYEDEVATCRPSIKVWDWNTIVIPVLLSGSPDCNRNLIHLYSAIYRWKTILYTFLQTRKIEYSIYELLIIYEEEHLNIKKKSMSDSQKNITQVN